MSEWIALVAAGSTWVLVYVYVLVRGERWINQGGPRPGGYVPADRRDVS